MISLKLINTQPWQHRRHSQKIWWKDLKTFTKVKLTSIRVVDSNRRKEYIRAPCYVMILIWSTCETLECSQVGIKSRSLYLEGLRKYWILAPVSGNISDVTTPRFVIIYHTWYGSELWGKNQSIFIQTYVYVHGESSDENVKTVRCSPLCFIYSSRRELTE